MSRVKETSDALNPPVVEAAHVVVPARARSVGDNLALALATCGVGLIPLARACMNHSPCFPRADALGFMLAPASRVEEEFLSTLKH